MGCGIGSGLVGEELPPFRTSYWIVQNSCSICLNIEKFITLIHSIIQPTQQTIPIFVSLMDLCDLYHKVIKQAISL